ncbi:RidA family protein [Ancylobacter defluvii]|nr:RidA family protein [Ancylobacter defluvii]MBS7588483.1 RidA family protein [Ancylobacter defluvii]
MPIERLGTGPRMSQVNVFGGETVYLAGQIAKAKAGASIREQTEEILANVDAHLASVGSSRERILQATILLADMKDFDEMNSVWDVWVPQGSTPARACYEAKLNRPALGVEVIIVAAR